MVSVMFWNFYLQFWIFIAYFGLELNTMTIFYYSGYGSSPTFSQMDREHSSKTSAKALYGMFIY